MSIQENDIRAITGDETYAQDKSKLVGGLLSDVLERMRTDAVFVDKGLKELNSGPDTHEDAGSFRTKVSPLRATVYYLKLLCADPLRKQRFAQDKALKGAGEGILEIAGSVISADITSKHGVSTFVLNRRSEHIAKHPEDQQGEEFEKSFAIYKEILTRDVRLLTIDPSGFLVAQATYSDTFPSLPKHIPLTEIEISSARPKPGEDIKRGANFAVSAYPLIYSRAERMFQTSS